MSLLVRFALAAIFIFAGVPKIMDTASFAGAVYNYQLLPEALINLFAIILPWLEVIVGILLILGVWLPGAVIIYNGLLISFIAALIISSIRGLDISCGCFSTDSTHGIDLWTILRDASMLLASLYLLFVVFVKKITSDSNGIWPKQTAACRPNKLAGR
ncbi:MAG: DoxX family membrane protein [Desulfobacteraceae bacterium]|nr:MAG: DoxX family membrane protein [Desulfobacteraceae bacterium]